MTRHVLRKGFSVEEAPGGVGHLVDARTGDALVLTPGELALLSSAGKAGVDTGAAGVAELLARCGPFFVEAGTAAPHSFYEPRHRGRPDRHELPQHGPGHSPAGALPQRGGRAEGRARAGRRARRGGHVDPLPRRDADRSRGAADGRAPGLRAAASQRGGHRARRRASRACGPVPLPGGEPAPGAGDPADGTGQRGRGAGGDRPRQRGRAAPPRAAPFGSEPAAPGAHPRGCDAARAGRRGDLRLASRRRGRASSSARDARASEAGAPRCGGARADRRRRGRAPGGRDRRSRRRRSAAGGRDTRARRRQRRHAGIGGPDLAGGRGAGARPGEDGRSGGRGRRRGSPGTSPRGSGSRPGRCWGRWRAHRSARRRWG